MDKLLNMLSADAGNYLLWIIVGTGVIAVIVFVVLVVILWRVGPALRDMPSWMAEVDAKLNDLVNDTNRLIVKVDNLCDKVDAICGKVDDLCHRIDALCEKMETIHHSPAREG